MDTFLILCNKIIYNGSNASQHHKGAEKDAHYTCCKL